MSVTVRRTPSTPRARSPQSSVASRKAGAPAAQRVPPPQLGVAQAALSATQTSASAQMGPSAAPQWHAPSSPATQPSSQSGGCSQAKRKKKKETKPSARFMKLTR